MHILEHGLAYIRGIKLKVYFKIHKKNCTCGNYVRIMKGVKIRVKKGSEIHIGNHVRIDTNVLISALNGGKISIGNNVAIGEFNRVISHEKIEIGNETILAPNVYIYDHDHQFGENGVKRKEYFTAPVSIGERSWIGINSIILRGTFIGNCCIVGAGTLVKTRVEDGRMLLQKRETIIR